MAVRVAQAQENVEVVRRAFERFRSGDAEALIELLDPEVKLYPYSGPSYRGHDGWRDFIGDRLQEGATFEADVADFLAHDDGVIAFGYIRMKSSGETSEMRVAWLFRVRGGKIICAEVYAGPDDEHGGRTSTPALLSEREREVLNLLAVGLTGEQIADRLYLSPETVRTHVRNARARLGARTRVEAVAKALILGEIECREPAC